MKRISGHDSDSNKKPRNLQNTNPFPEQPLRQPSPLRQPQSTVQTDDISAIKKVVEQVAIVNLNAKQTMQKNQTDKRLATVFDLKESFMSELQKTDPTTFQAIIGLETPQQQIYALKENATPAIKKLSLKYRMLFESLPETWNKIQSKPSKSNTNEETAAFLHDLIYVDLTNDNDEDKKPTARPQIQQRTETFVFDQEQAHNDVNALLQELKNKPETLSEIKLLQSSELKKSLYNEIQGKYPVLYNTLKQQTSEKKRLEMLRDNPNQDVRDIFLNHQNKFKELHYNAN